MIQAMQNPGVNIHVKNESSIRLFERYDTTCVKVGKNYYCIFYFFEDMASFAIQGTLLLSSLVGSLIAWAIFGVKFLLTKRRWTS